MFYKMNTSVPGNYICIIFKKYVNFNIVCFRVSFVRPLSHVLNFVE